MKDKLQKDQDYKKALTDYQKAESAASQQVADLLANAGLTQNKIYAPAALSAVNREAQKAAVRAQVYEGERGGVAEVISRYSGTIRNIGKFAAAGALAATAAAVVTGAAPAAALALGGGLLAKGATALGLSNKVRRINAQMNASSAASGEQALIHGVTMNNIAANMSIEDVVGSTIGDRSDALVGANNNRNRWQTAIGVGAMALGSVAGAYAGEFLASINVGGEDSAAEAVADRLVDTSGDINVHDMYDGGFDVTENAPTTSDITIDVDSDNGFTQEFVQPIEDGGFGLTTDQSVELYNELYPTLDGTDGTYTAANQYPDILEGANEVRISDTGEFTFNPEQSEIIRDYLDSQGIEIEGITDVDTAGVDVDVDETDDDPTGVDVISDEPTPTETDPGSPDDDRDFYQGPFNIDVPGPNWLPGAAAIGLGGYAGYRGLSAIADSDAAQQAQDQARRVERRAQQTPAADPKTAPTAVMPAVPSNPTTTPGTTPETPTAPSTIKIDENAPVASLEIAIPDIAANIAQRIVDRSSPSENYDLGNDVDFKRFIKAIQAKEYQLTDREKQDLMTGMMRGIQEAVSNEQKLQKGSQEDAPDQLEATKERARIQEAAQNLLGAMNEGDGTQYDSLEALVKDAGHVREQNETITRMAQVAAPQIMAELDQARAAGEGGEVSLNESPMYKAARAIVMRAQEKNYSKENDVEISRMRHAQRLAVERLNAQVNAQLKQLSSQTTSSDDSTQADADDLSLAA